MQSRIVLVLAKPVKYCVYDWLDPQMQLLAETDSTPTAPKSLRITAEQCAASPAGLMMFAGLDSDGRTKGCILQAIALTEKTSAI